MQKYIDIMVVYELKKYPELYKKAVKNVEKYSGNTNIEKINNLSLGMAFGWSNTPEGGVFWESLHKGDWSKAKSIHPHLFAPNKIQTKAGNMEVKENGLWER
jgi:hypothetical protein